MSNWVEIYRTTQSWEALMLHNTLQESNIPSTVQQWTPTYGMKVLNPANMGDETNFMQIGTYVTVSVLDNQLEQANGILENLNFNAGKEDKKLPLSDQEFKSLSRKALLIVLIAFFLLFVLPYFIGKYLIP